jgi:Rha family phage regulatory protein
MKELQVFNSNGKDVVDSREVAEMVERNHKDLLRDIRNYTGILEKSAERKIAPSDFFIPHTYRDSMGRTLPCYLLTKKGCDMVANKMTGEKGVLFTAAYVSAFEKMREKITGGSAILPRDYPSALRALADAEEKRMALETELDRSKEWYSIKRVAHLNGVSYKVFDWRRLKLESQRQGYGVKKIFDANYGEVNTYHMNVWETVYPEMEL